MTAVTALPRRDPATACRSLGGYGPAVTAVTAVIIGIRIPRAVTAVIIAPAVTAVTAVIVWIRIARAVTAVIFVPAVTTVTRRAFVTCPGGHGPPWAP
jgi:hypothetical protein